MERQYISVFTLNKYIKAKMEQDVSLQSVYIKGEISNYRPHPSGHLYFTLKDENSRISAVMFASQAKKINFALDNGIQVLIRATVSVYEVNGQYQLYVQSMEQDGIGNLYLQYELLKKKLEKEGLFDNQFKKEIPSFPKSIAVLSAKQGAAVQDIVRTIHLRFPFTKVIVFPIPVQGKNAYLQMIETLKYVDSIGFETVILARGGGSIEDLWNFNEEQLVRCIFEMKTPVITGIGHETDFTICDFVSDYRAVTPTAAAIKATPDQFELRKNCSDLLNQLIYKMNHRIQVQRNVFDRLQSSYCFTYPDRIYSDKVLHLSHLENQLSYQFKMFDMKIFQELVEYQNQLKSSIDMKVKNSFHKQQELIIQLDALSPLKVMQRGYTLIKKDNVVIKNGKMLSSGDIIDIQFYNDIKKAEIK